MVYLKIIVVIFGIIKKIRHIKGNAPVVIDDCYLDVEIANHFASTYEKLLSSVPSSTSDLNWVDDIINTLLQDKAHAIQFTVTYSDIVMAVSKLKTGKSASCTGLTSDYFINACDELFVHLGLLINTMFSHGIVIDDLLLSTIVPIPKSKLASNSSANFRGITLSSIIGKIVDLVCLCRLSDHLVTSDLQFGFKKAHSTNMCTMLLKETVAYYTSNSNSVFCFF